MTLTYNLHATVHLSDMKSLVKLLENYDLTTFGEPIGDKLLLTRLVIKSKRDIKPNDILQIGAFIGQLENIALAQW